MNSQTAVRATPLFWLIAIALTMWGLGHTGMWNSEDRWMQIAREMQISGNYLRPTINGEVYFDKPLGSYWLVLLCSFFTGGINEWSLRLPSALSALLCLWATVDLGKRLWSAEVGRIAGWLLLTCYGLLMWSRSGEADMENMAASIFAVAWYWRVRAKPNFFAYFIFYLIIFVGAQTKGLTAAVVPILAIACDVLRERRWRAQLNFAHVSAMAAGSMVYLLPFMLAEAPSSGAAGDAGLWLVFRENVVRYFAPFDHDEPFYMYVPWLHVLWLPWLSLLWGGIAAIFIDRKAHTATTRWLIHAAGAIFLFFLLSGSRRIYYILPLLPYCALLIALFLQREDLPRLRVALLRLQAALLGVAVILLLVLPLLLPWWAARAHIAMPADFSARSFVFIGIAALLYWLLSGRVPALRTAFGFNDKRTPGNLPVLIGVAAILQAGFFVQIRPLQDSYRTQWPFARELKTLAKPLPAAQIAVISRRISAGLMYYAELPIGVGEIHNAEEALRFLQTPPYPKLIVVERGEFAHLPPALRQLPPAVVELRQPWEKSRKEKMQAWLLDAPPP